ncbi:phage virion morphogenesis protein [Escherichia coli]
MDAENYVIQYPLDAVHVDKFADLLGKPKTAVSEMVKANKLPIIELRDPCKPKARAGEKWVFIPEFNRAVREAFYIRASPEQASMEFYGGKSPKIASVHQFGLSEETRKDGKKIDYPARPLLGFTGEDVQMIEEIILAHLDR